jgi:hypothetical protein
MTKAEALSRTNIRFTNLIDGKVRSGVSVSQIIEYYESSIKEESLNLDRPPAIGNIENCFYKAEISHYEEEGYDDYTDYSGL